MIWLWRRPAMVAAAVAGLVMAWFSLGPRVVINGERTGIWAPYELLRDGRRWSRARCRCGSRCR